MKNNLAINNEITESICLLDEACNIYPGLLEVRTKYPNIYREFEFDYKQLCYSINSEIVNFSDAKNTLDTLFRIHVSNLDFNDQKEQNVSFLVDGSRKHLINKNSLEYSLGDCDDNYIAAESNLSCLKAASSSQN